MHRIWVQTPAHKNRKKKPHRTSKENSKTLLENSRKTNEETHTV
jgi:hypothetical protein